MRFAVIIAHEYEQYDMTIAAVPAFEFYFNDCGKQSLAEIVNEQSYRYVINASFFHFERSNNAQQMPEGCKTNYIHVGQLKFGGEQYPSKVMNELDHAQLTHIAQYDPTIPQLRFVAEGAICFGRYFPH